MFDTVERIFLIFLELTTLFNNILNFTSKIQSYFHVCRNKPASDNT